MQTTVRTCVSVAKSDIEALGRDLHRAHELGAKRGEARLDELPMDEITSPRVSELVDSLRDKLGLVLTIRSVEQKGSFSGSMDKTVSVLEVLASMNPMMLDVELRVARERPDFLRHLRDIGVPVLLSHHDWEGTSPTEELHKILMFSNGL